MPHFSEDGSAWLEGGARYFEPPTYTDDVVARPYAMIRTFAPYQPVKTFAPYQPQQVMTPERFTPDHA